MNFPVSRQAAATTASLAFVFSLSVAAPVLAQASAQELSPVVVSASRFADQADAVPIGASIITAGQIREAGIGNVNQAIRMIGGVYGRYNTRGTSDYSLDLRGFGTNSDQNLVVLVDGIRLSESEQTSALLSSIPIETVERIEIVRGGSSVLYGEGATSGTIQIITKRADRNAASASAVAELGSFNHRDLRGSIARSWGNLSLDANVSTQRADNYRDNNETRQNNFSGGLQWALEQGRAGLRVDVARQASGFAGSLSAAQFRANPRQASTPDDYGNVESERYMAFLERGLGAFELATELSHRESKVGSFFSAYGGTRSESRSRVTQFSPRLRHAMQADGWKNELVVGFDVLDWERRSDSAYLPSKSTQQSQGVYMRNQVTLDDARVVAGVRREFFDKDADQGATELYRISHALTAWELQGDYRLTPLVKVFAKTGTSYRVANVDDNNSTPVLNQPLRPQTSRDHEIGLTFGGPARELTARLFQHRLRNEIFFDPTSPAPFFFGANVNLDPTRREGFELEGSTVLASTFVLSGSWQHVKAKFTEGPNAGREMVLVPENTATLRLGWQPGSGRSADVGLRWASSQRYGDDFTNACSARIPSFVTLDARYARQIGPWELSVAGSNLTDRSYYTQAFACQGSIYPEAGRQIRVALRREF